MRERAMRRAPLSLVKAALVLEKHLAARLPSLLCRKLAQVCAFPRGGIRIFAARVKAAVMSR